MQTPTVYTPRQSQSFRNYQGFFRLTDCWQDSGWYLNGHGIVKTTLFPEDFPHSETIQWERIKMIDIHENVSEVLRA